MISCNYLLNYSWPGNIKELETFINRLVILSPGQLINEKFIKGELDKVKEQLKNNFSNFSEIFDLELEKFFKNQDVSRYSNSLYNFLLRKLENSLLRKTLSVVNGNRGRPVPVVLGHEGTGVIVEVGAAAWMVW